MPISDLYAEYNKRTGGNITPPKKVITCAASVTHLKLGESVIEVPKVKKGQISAEFSHIATSNFKFGDSPTPNESTFRPSRVPGNESAIASKIEFGASEPEIIRVKKGQAPEEIIHVASTRVAFGSRNIPKEGDLTKPSKKKTAGGLNSAADHITFGAALEQPAPEPVVKCNVSAILEDTEKNMVPTDQAAKPAKLMIDCAAHGNKELMIETLSAPSGLAPLSAPLTATRLPVGGNTTITFGDTFSPASSPIQTNIFPEMNVKSAMPVKVEHTSRNMQSSCFNHETPVPVDRRAKKEVENVCPNEVPLTLETSSPSKMAAGTSSTPPRSAKKKTVHSDKDSLSSIFSTDGMTYDNTPVRSAKKTIPTSTIFAFAASNEVNFAPKEKLMPTVPKSNAAGAKPKSLEPVVRARGPVGGNVSVIFG
jgi:hypothetical protein